MIDEYSIMEDERFADFFNPKRKAMIAHKALSNYFTYGARKTGLEHLKLKDLFTKFYDELHFAAFTNKFEGVSAAITEVTNRLLKKLKTPGVATKMYFGENEIMSAGVKRLNLGEVGENASIDVNLNMLEQCTPFAIFHECKHLAQRYAFNNLMKGFKTDNNQAVCGVLAYCNLLSGYNYLSYDLAIDELDANMFAFKTMQSLSAAGCFDDVSIAEIDYMKLLAYAQCYECLKNFKYAEGQISPKIQKQLKDGFNKAVADLHKNEFFSAEQLQAIDNLSIDDFIKSANKQLAEISNEFLYMTMAYEKEYGIKMIKAGSFDRKKYEANMSVIHNGILKKYDVSLNEEETM